MPRNRRRWVVLLVGYLVLLGVVGLWGTAVDAPVRAQLDGALAWLADHGAGVIRYGHIEALANLCLFVPLGLLVAGALPSRFWWLAVPVGLLLSGFIEIAQMGIAGRTPSVGDIVFNTAGALVGATISRLVLAARRADG